MYCVCRCVEFVGLVYSGAKMIPEAVTLTEKCFPRQPMHNNTMVKLFTSQYCTVLGFCFHFCFEFVDTLHFGNSVHEVIRVVLSRNDS